MNTYKKDLLVQNKNDRTLNIFHEIDEDTYIQIEKFINSIILEDEYCAEHNAYILKRYFNLDIDFSDKKYNPDVTISINSIGGNVYQGLAMYDNIKTLSNHCKVNVIGKGIVASAASFIFLAAPYEQRTCTRNTTFMIHQVSGFAFGEMKSMEENVEQGKILNDTIFNIITSNTKITKETLQEYYDKKYDWFINAEKALELGIVSKIID